jgi:RNA polymerase sigma-70 factor (ECF subfamily)
MVKGNEDAALLAQIATGDRVAFGVLLERYLDSVVKFAARYTGNIADAEDIAQETFTQAWLKASDWRDQGFSVRSWLYRVAYNRCVDLARRRRPDMPIDGLELPAGLLADPAERTSSDALVARLAESMAALPERQYMALTLCALEGLSNKEAATVLGIGLEALESLLARGRRKLRELMIEEEKEVAP